ncbi:MAG TPA: hypothetical protein VM578_00945 [Candidatus Saccharimonadales bacterium]|nr:hypothetical protein [Candidatus Saccharimonadales bacterium]
MMSRQLRSMLLLLLVFTPLASMAAGKPKVHVISFGKVMAVKLFLGPDEEHTAPLKVRALYVDTKLKEFVTGEAHEVTDRLFVVRRAYRLNDNLPTDESKAPNWIWQRGGWLMVDRLTARVSQVSLVEFDPFYSHASWFRDYVAYCGVSDNGEKLSAVVMQLGRKKPVLKKELGTASQGGMPDSECEAPGWEKRPTRVTFLPKHAEKQAFSIFGHAWDAAPGSEEE